jgi:recombination protein RecA
MAGRLVEITSDTTGRCTSSVTTAGLRLIRRAQQRREPAAWICGSEATFYPPDARRCGVDLSLLPVVRLDRADEMGRAADRLVRSGGFGLVVIDLRESPAHSELAEGLQRRLLTHAEADDVAVVLLTGGEAGGARGGQAAGSSLGPTVSCRIEAARRRRGLSSMQGVGGGSEEDPEVEANEGLFECRLEALSDARFGPGWSLREVVDGPPGLH